MIGRLFAPGTWYTALASLFLFLGAIGFSAAQDAPKTVYFSKIQGSINPATASYLKSSIAAAEAVDCEALVVELDTPGGLVSSVRSMAQMIDESKIPVVVYVTPAGASATSAGALLSLAAHHSAMAPGTNIGAAHPVGSGGEDIKGAMGEKAVNDTAAFARGLAEIRGRDPKLAEQIVSKSTSFTAQEALDKGVVDLVAKDRAELLVKLEGRQVQKLKRVIRSQGAKAEDLEMTLGQKVLHFFADPNIAGLLISLGLLCLYVEITTPGITIPGVIGGVLLLVGFMALQLLPIRLGGLLLIVLGIAFLIGELFVTTHGALAFGGTIAFVLGLIWVIDPGSTSLTVHPAIWVSAAIVLGGGAVLIAWAATRGRLLVKKTLKEIGGGSELGLSGYHGRVESVDAGGTTGKALIRGETWDFESQDTVRTGDQVEVERTQGFRAFVRPARGKK